MAEALAIVFLIGLVVHIIGAVGYVSGGGKPQNSLFFQTLGVLETLVALALAVAVLV